MFVGIYKGCEFWWCFCSSKNLKEKKEFLMNPFKSTNLVKICIERCDSANPMFLHGNQNCAIGKVDAAVIVIEQFKCLIIILIG